MIGIVIVNYNTWEKTIKCVQSILDVCTLDYKIYLVDNSSLNDSYDRLYEKYRGNENIKIIKTSRNGGYAYGLNIGSKHACSDKCDAILESNNDIIYLSNSIERMYKTLVENREVAVVGAQLIGKDGIKQVSAEKNRPNFFNRVLAAFGNKKTKRDRKSQIALLNANEAQEVFLVVGACFMIKTSALEDIGYFDENTFLYCEERILSYRLEKKGYKVYFEPLAKVIHEHSGTIGGSSPFSDLEFLKSHLYAIKEYEDYNWIKILTMKVLYGCRFLIKAMIKHEYRKYVKQLFLVLRAKIISYNVTL